MSIEVVVVVATPSFCIHRMSTAAAENVCGGGRRRKRGCYTSKRKNVSTNYIIPTYIAYGKGGISLCLCCGITRKGSHGSSETTILDILLLFSLFISVMGLHSESICTSLHRQHLCKGIYYVDKGAKR